VKSGIY